MRLEITNLEKGTKLSRNGKDLSGLNVTGIKIDQDGNPGDQWDKFLMDWKNPEEIATLENAGVGAKVNITNERDPQNSRFWNVVGVSVMSAGEGASSVTVAETKPAESKPATKTETAKPAAASVAVAAYPAMQLPVVKSTALNAALEFTHSLVTSGERFKKILAATKTTNETLMQLTLENASEFEAYLNGKVDSDVKSDDADLDKGGVDAGEPNLPGAEDDDIPF
jgi:hypothetical protein